MEIKRTGKASQISETENNETNSASSKNVSIFSTPDSFEYGNSNRSMFEAPQPQSPLSKVSESLEKQLNTTRIEQSMIGTSSLQPVSRANDKQAEFTKARTEFQEAVDARAQEQLTGMADHILDGISDGSNVLGGDGMVPITPDLLKFDPFGTQTTTENPPRPEPTLANEINQKQKFFNELLESNRTKPTSSVQDERIKNVKDHNNVQAFHPSIEPTSSLNEERVRNVKDHNNVQTFFPSIEPTSRANDKQADFTEAKAEFDKTVEEERAKQQIKDFVNNQPNPLDDLLNGIDLFKEEASTPTAESNRKQKELTDLLASNRVALKNS